MLLAATVLAATFGAAAPAAFGQPDQPTFVDRDYRDGRVCAGRAEPKGTAPFLRTELYFGTNKSDGSVVTPEQFQDFVNEKITPRFPDGLTLLTGVGQFKGSNGLIQRERSVVLILLYPVDTARSSGEKIEAIRNDYKTKFMQESVLRADEPQPECVSF
jgi:hypothetical protein